MSRRRSQRDDLSTRNRRRVKKERYPPVDAETLFDGINELRRGMGVNHIRKKPEFEALKDKLQDDPATRDKVIEDMRIMPDQCDEDRPFIALSVFSVFDVVDNKMSTFDLLNRWMNDPSKRPVLLAPATHGYVDCEEMDENDKQVCFIVAYIYK
jgi:hypothetical protein